MSKSDAHVENAEIRRQRSLHITTLPDDVFYIIFKYLPVKDVASYETAFNVSTAAGQQSYRMKCSNTVVEFHESTWRITFPQVLILMGAYLINFKYIHSPWNNNKTRRQINNLIRYYCPNLRFLHLLSYIIMPEEELKRTDVNDNVAEKGKILQTPTGLEGLTVTGFFATDQSIRNYLTSNKDTLRKLTINVRFSESISNNTLLSLAKYNCINTLEFRYADERHISRYDIVRILAQSCTALQEIKIINCTFIIQAILLELSALPNITVLELRDCSNLFPDTVVNFVHRSKSLKELRIVSSSESVMPGFKDSQFINRVFKQNPKLKLRIRGNSSVLPMYR